MTAQDALGRLDQHARELDSCSNALAELQRALEEVDQEYRAFVDDFEVGLYLQCEADGKRLPSEAMRLKLARRKMAPELLGRRDGLVMRRDRLRQRISDLKTIVDSERSILVALKEATV